MDVSIHRRKQCLKNRSSKCGYPGAGQAGRPAFLRRGGEVRGQAVEYRRRRKLCHCCSKTKKITKNQFAFFWRPNWSHFENRKSDYFAWTPFFQFSRDGTRRSKQRFYLEVKARLKWREYLARYPGKLFWLNLISPGNQRKIRRRRQRYTSPNPMFCGHINNQLIYKTMYDENDHKIKVWLHRDLSRIGIDENLGSCNEKSFRLCSHRFPKNSLVWGEDVVR